MSVDSKLFFLPSFLQGQAAQMVRPSLLLCLPWLARSLQAPRKHASLRPQEAATTVAEKETRVVMKFGALVDLIE